MLKKGSNEIACWRIKRKESVCLPKMIFCILAMNVDKERLSWVAEDFRNSFLV